MEKARSYHFKLDSYGLSGLRLQWSTGNRKVDCPVFNVTSARACPLRRSCEFSKQNHVKAGKPLCYAVNTERCYPHCSEAREKNEAAIRAINKLPKAERHLVITRFAREILRKRQNPASCVRINESGEVAMWNVNFLAMLCAALFVRDAIPFLYTKQKDVYVDRLKSAGATVLRSEVDFVAVPDVKTAKRLGLALCPGEGCGLSCLRCPMGLKTAVLYH